jgi:hypothetical protein
MLNLSMIKIREIVIMSAPLNLEGLKRFDHKFNLFQYVSSILSFSTISDYLIQ